jgi:type IV pilus assembly protein PilA
MRRFAKGFTMVELMVVVAIIALLAMVATPLYQDYAIRAKVSELVTYPAGFQPTIAEKSNSDGTLSSAGIGLTVTASGRVTGGLVNDNGVITIAGSSTSIGTAVSIVLSPTLASGRLTWSCSTNTDTSQWKYVPTECRH